MVCDLPGDADQVLAEVEVTTAAGAAAYLVPLGVVWEEEAADPYVQALSMGRVRRGPRLGELTDAFATSAFVRSIIAGLRDQSRLLTARGELVFETTAAFDVEADAQLEWPAAEQSNSSVIVGRQAVLKLLRKVTPGIHPEAELTRRLTERGFEHIAPLLGEVRLIAPDGTPHTLMVAQSFIYHQGDGWAWTLDYLPAGH